MPDTYGQLGIVFFKSRNYEGSILPLQCAVRGCTPEESCEARNGCDEKAGEFGVQVKGLPLSPNTVVYYYTYGSVLSALSRPQQNYCPEALDVFARGATGLSAEIPTSCPLSRRGRTSARAWLKKWAHRYCPYPTSTPEPRHLRLPRP